MFSLLLSYRFDWLVGWLIGGLVVIILMDLLLLFYFDISGDGWD
jgi:hypothetical protein